MDYRDIIIKPLYLKYVPDDKKEEVQYSLLCDVYYFYHGVKPTYEQIVIPVNDNLFDVSKNNLRLVTKP